MRLLLTALATAGALAVSGAATAQDRGCTKNIFGEACWIKKGTDRLTEADYGAIVADFQPPADVNSQTDGALRKSLKNNIFRYFKKDTKSVAITLEVYDKAGTKMATLPLALASVDTKAGINVQDEIQLGAQRISPLFRVEDEADPIRAKINVLISDKPTSQVLPIVTEVVTAATTLGGHGWLSAAAANADIQNSLGALETRLTQHFQVAASSTLTVPMNFGNASRLEYDFGFDPRPGAKRTGKLVVYLERRPSLWADKVVSNSIPAVPDYARGEIYDVSLTNPYLTRNISSAKTIRDVLQEKSSTASWADFNSDTVELNVFNRACDAVRTASLHKDLALNGADATAVFWAAYANSGNAARREARDTPCIRAILPAFSRHKLPLPSLPPIPAPPIAAVSPDRLEAWVQSAFIPALTSHAPPALRAAQLRALLGGDLTPNVTKSLSDTDPVTVGIRDLSYLESARAVAEKLAAADFSAGCYFLADESRVLMLARRTDQATPPLSRPLWIVQLATSGAKNGPIWVSGIDLREVGGTDDSAMVQFRTALPKTPRCHDTAVAPSGT